MHTSVLLYGDHSGAHFRIWYGINTCDSYYHKLSFLPPFLLHLLCDFSVDCPLSDRSNYICGKPNSRLNFTCHDDKISYIFVMVFVQCVLFTECCDLLEFIWSRLQIPAQISAILTEVVRVLRFLQANSRAKAASFLVVCSSFSPIIPSFDMP
jgi:hypothetical protein